MRMAALLAVVVMAAAMMPAMAEEPAPEYFVTSAFETSTAQIVALSCETISVDPIAMARSTETVLARLTDDGFTPENLATRMEDPSEAIGILQDAFLVRHGLADGASEDAVCAAGRAEIALGSPLGKLLIEVAASESADQ